MRQVRRSAIVPYPAAAMFDLVADVARYPEFLPGCSAASLDASSEHELRGSIEFATGPLNMRLSTRNALDPPRSMTIELLRGPFRRLSGLWTFEPFGGQGCRVTLEIQFEFSNRAADALLGPVFAVSCDNLVDAFVRRAAVIYG